jgi:hypothetical protein
MSLSLSSGTHSRNPLVNGYRNPLDRWHLRASDRSDRDQSKRSPDERSDIRVYEFRRCPHVAALMRQMQVAPPFDRRQYRASDRLTGIKA